MLDSAPVPSGPDTVPVSVADRAATTPGAQMQMGFHTSAFGNVEVHTIIEQSQVSISIHGDRELARWFNSEVSGLETGLRNQHLNLTGVDMSSSRSGVQTSTGFQNGQPRHSFGQNAPSGGGVAATPPADAELEVEPPAAAIPIALPETRVSILA